MPVTSSNLKGIDIFHRLQPARLEKIASVCMEQEFCTGEELAAVTNGTLREGQSSGEIALVDKGIRSATVRLAQHNTRLLVIPIDRLIARCDADTALGYRLMHNLAADLAMKVRNSDLRLREQIINPDLDNRGI